MLINNEKNEWVIGPTQLITEYDDWRDAGEFASNGLAGIIYYSYDDGSEKTGYINAKGEWMIQPQFYISTNFGTQYATAQELEILNSLKSGGKWGVIDETGNWILEPQPKSVFWNLESRA